MMVLASRMKLAESAPILTNMGADKARILGIISERVEDPNCPGQKNAVFKFTGKKKECNATSRIR